MTLDIGIERPDLDERLERAASRAWSCPESIAPSDCRRLGEVYEAYRDLVEDHTTEEAVLLLRSIRRAVRAEARRRAVKP